MKFREVRDRVVRVIGRLDFTPEDIKYFVDSGQRYLELHTELAAENAVTPYILAPGCNCIIHWTRELHGVYVDAADSPRQLHRARDLNAFVAASRCSGSPVCFFEVPIRRFPNPAMEEGLPELELKFPIDSDNYTNKAGQGLGIAPAPAQGTTLLIVGRQQFDFMQADDDENYWAQMHPDLLVRATARAYETELRNRTGVDDFEQPLRRDLLALSNELAGYEAAIYSDYVG